MATAGTMDTRIPGSIRSMDASAAHAKKFRWKLSMLFLAGHIPLALLMHEVTLLAMMVPFVLFGIGLLWTFTKEDDIHLVYIIAYMMSAEALWRQVHGLLYWEFVKYVAILIFLIRIVLSGRLHRIVLPCLFCCMLLPSIIRTIDYLPSLFFDVLSKNLSGPFALAVCVLFLSRLRIQERELHNVLILMTAPALSAAVVATYSTLTTPIVYFSNDSMMQTSGGFGPNQVSSAIGLGALCAYYFVIDNKLPRLFRVFLVPVLLYLLVQSAMTFSRSGLFLAGLGGIASSFYLVRSPRYRLPILFSAVMGALVIAFVLLPKLMDFTHGAIVTRFTEKSMTKRDVIIRSDLAMWRDHFFLGVGAGASQYKRVEYIGRRRSAHTEYTRLLAEHGLFGLFALVLLCLMVLQISANTVSMKDKAFTAAFLAWSLAFMFFNATRLAIPSFLFGLASARLSVRPACCLRTCPKAGEPGGNMP